MPPIVATGGKEHDGHILHAAAQHRADQYPQSARQIAELRRQRRPDQRPRPGDGGEMVAEHHPPVGRHEIAPIVEAFRRRRPCFIQHQHLGRQPGAVKPVGESVNARRCGNEPDRVDALTPVKGDAAHRRRTENRHQQPAYPRKNRALHFYPFNRSFK